MSDEQEKPCGEYHPLPCGLDEACGFTDHHVPYDELRELIGDWREQAELQESFGNDALGEMAEQHADELEELIND